MSQQVPLAKPDLGKLEEQYLIEVIRSNQLSFGPMLHAFEKHFTKRFQIPYALAMNSGTSALHVAVKALGLKQGDEVITTPYSFVASANCLIYEQVKPLFVDINPENLNIDIDQIEAMITPKTRAILAVHIFGQPCNMREIMRIAKKYNLYVIEDACEAIGATWEGQLAGTFGDIGVFAFYPNKQITTGEGGILITKHKHIYELGNSYRNQGRSISNEWLLHERVGYNYRMSDLQAAVGVAQMERLDEILAKRNQAAKRYIQLIEELRVPVSLPKVAKEAYMSWFVFVVLLHEKVSQTRVIKKLSACGIQSKPYFPAIHLQPSYKSLFQYKQGQFPHCEAAATRTLAIPFFNSITEEEQRYVLQSLKEAIKTEGIS